MRISHASLSIAGPVRPNNEDSLAFWEPEVEADWRDRGAVIVLADGVGGHEGGEIASRMACESAIAALVDARPGNTPTQLLLQMFTAANSAVYGANVASGKYEKMATTLTITLFRNHTIDIGHVGDCRVYLVQPAGISRLTSDHSYAGVQLKLGLVTVQQSLASDLRSVLTRTVGQEPSVRVDYHSAVVKAGDIVVQMCDGIWSRITEKEIEKAVASQPPEQACRDLVDLAERRGADDNLSVQVVRIEAVERLSFYRGLAIYHKELPAVPGSELEVGQTLDGRYAISDLISRSGMASIFKAADLKTERMVALKVPLLQFESDPAFFSRFQREQKIGQTLHHPYIMRVEPEDADTPRSRPYLVMELLEGQTLRHLMQSVRPMPAADALRIAAYICEALQYMHDQEVVHRDLKPDNVMICNNGTIRIMDFGIAKSEGRRLTFGGFTPAMGTPDYMAPEQVQGRRGDARTDLYSLGAILYEMVTGVTPFEGENPFIIMNARVSGDPPAPRSHNPQLSEQLEEIILHAMARAPGDRYSSAAAMKKELEDPLHVQVTGRAQRLVTSTTVKRWSTRRRWIIAATTAIVLAATAWFLSQHLRWD